MGRTYRKRKNKLNAHQINTKIVNIGASADIIALQKYLISKGWSNDSKLIAGWSAETGRGIFARMKFSAQDALIELPFDVLISVATMENDENFKDILFTFGYEPPVKLSFQCLLSFYLIYLQHTNQQKTYLDTIPQTYTNPIFCTKDELMLLPSFLFADILKQDNKIKANFAALSVLLSDLKCDCCQRKFISDICTIKTFKWAFISVNTRCVYVNPKNCRELCQTNDLENVLLDEPKSALAPFLDLFNHSDSVKSTSNILIELDSSNKHRFKYQLKVDQNFPKKQQIYVNYGPLSNAELIVEYGFSISNNKFDRIAISMEDVNDLVRASKRRDIHRNKFRFIEANAIGEEMYFDRIDGVSHQLCIVLKLIFETEVHFDNVLNKVAFNETPNLNDVRSWALSLINLKKDNFELSRKSLANLLIEKDLSDCGRMVVRFIEESIYLLDYVVQTFLK